LEVSVLTHAEAVAPDADDMAVGHEASIRALAMTSSPTTSPQSSKPWLLVSEAETKLRA
jgi:hypothetical protein